MPTLSLSTARSLSQRALERCGLNPSGISAITDVIVAAERDRATSHGLFRLPGYCAALLHGKVDGKVTPTVIDAAPAVVIVDAHGGFAPPAFLAGRPLLVQKTYESGFAALALRNQCHFSALWFEAEVLAADGLGCLAFVNSKAFVAHSGTSSERLYGTNPMAFSWPRPASAGPPLVFDQASAAMARGEIQLAERAGTALPDGVALGPEGRPTNDPAKALAGSQLPFGGHKGANIALMVELLAGALTGSALAVETAAEDPDWYGPTSNGELILAFDPSRFSLPSDSTSHTALERAESLLQRVESLAGRLPGARRAKNRAAADEATAEVRVDRALHDEILSIIDGGLPTSQAYV